MEAKSVTNPLTIIAIFAGLAEIAGTTALKLVSSDIQPIFIWFVMLFPVLLILLFFITLNFNPKVLYAPSDFRSDENFLNAIYGAKLSWSLETVQGQLEEARSQIVAEAIDEMGTVSTQARVRLEEIVNSKIAMVQQEIEATRETAASAQRLLLNVSDINIGPPESMKARIVALLAQEGRPMTLRDIRHRFGDSTVLSYSFRRRFRELLQSGVVMELPGENGAVYALMDADKRETVR